MSLDWDITGCENSEELKSEKQWPTTSILIHTTMIVGMGKITEKNVDEFYARCKLYEDLFGTFRNRVGEHDQLEPYPYTYQEIHRYIGLSTNVPLESLTKWTNRMMKNKLKEVQRVVAREKKELLEEVV